MLSRNLSKQVFNLSKTILSNCTTRNLSVPAPLTSFTEEEDALRDQVAKISRETIAPYIKQMETEGRIVEPVLNSLFENGLMGIEVPEEYGGCKGSFTKSVITIEEVAKVDAAVSVLVDVHATVVAKFFASFASKEQQEEYLPKLATSWPGSFCLSEPSSGSDAFALKTTATKVGNKYVLNGTKMWISNSDIAKVFIVMANVDPEKGYKGITSFIVRRDNPGLTVGKKENKLGIKASGTCMLHFDNCEVDEKDLLGEVGQAYKYSINLLNQGRVGIGAQMIGIAQASLDATIPYLFDRKQFNQTLFSFQGVQHQVSRLVTEVETARLLVYNAARKLDAQQPCIKEAAMAKYYAAETAGKVTSQCIDLMGGVGFTKDFPQEKYYRDAKVGTIYEGATNVLLNTIAKSIQKEYGS